MKFTNKIFFRLPFLGIILVNSSLLFGQTTSFPNRNSVLKYFLSSPNVIGHFIYTKPTKDSLIIIADSGKILIEADIKYFGDLPIELDTSNSIRDSIQKSGIFSIKNKQRNYLILLSGNLEGKMFFSLYNPRTNGDCYIRFIRRKKLYYVEKISCGWF